MGFLRRAWHSAPLHVVGNIRFTRGGVFAEYLVSPTSFFYLGDTEQEAVADDHTLLYRELPGRASLDGLTAYREAEDVSRGMVIAGLPLSAREAYLKAGATGVPDLSGVTAQWNNSIRYLWEPHFRRLPLRYRQGWLTLRLDFGREGDNLMANVGKNLAGEDVDDPDVIDRYREIAAAMAAAQPSVFEPVPAAAEQIWWRWNATLSRGVWREPLPDVAFDENAVLDESAFTPGFFDENGAEIYDASGVSAENPLVRIYRDEREGIPDSYQAILPIDKFTPAGLTFPRSTLFKRADDLSTGGIVIDWHQNLQMNPPQKLHSDMVKMNINIEDQWVQRGAAAEVDNQLPRQMVLSRELASKCEEGSVVRAGVAGVVFTVAAPTPDLVAEGVKRLKTEFARAGIGFTRWRGAQKWLAHTMIPGAEAVCDIKKLRHRTTSDDLATLVPLVSSQLGDTFGVPLGVDITMPGMQDVVLSDLLAAPTRNKGAVMVLGGDPGRGKSTTVKTLETSWADLGARLGIIDPTPVREHERALSPIDDSKKLIIDAHRNRYSLDCVRLARRNHDILEELRRQGRTDIEEEHLPQPTDHLLSLTGFPVGSDPARRFQKHVAPRNLAAKDIHTSWGLIEYLRELPPGEKTPADETLLNELEALAADRHLRALWDQTLPVPDFTALSDRGVEHGVAGAADQRGNIDSPSARRIDAPPAGRPRDLWIGHRLDHAGVHFAAPGAIHADHRGVLRLDPQCGRRKGRLPGDDSGPQIQQRANGGGAKPRQDVQPDRIGIHHAEAEFRRSRMQRWPAPCSRSGAAGIWTATRDLMRQYAHDTSPVMRVNRRNRTQGAPARHRHSRPRGRSVAARRNR